MGSRLLIQYMKQPLQDAKLIRKRLDQVSLLLEDGQQFSYLKNDFLKKIPDLSSLCSKFYKIESGKKHKTSLFDLYKVYTVSKTLNKAFNWLKNTYNSQDTMDTSYKARTFVLEPLENITGDLENYEALIEKSQDMSQCHLTKSQG